MKIKLPKFKRTYEYIRRVVALEHCSPGVLAKMNGVERETVDAWGRPPESDEYPTGTGKKNPIDAFLRLIGLAHKDAPGLAREIASVGGEYVDYLDDLGGRPFTEQANVCEAVAKSVKEHSDVVVYYLHSSEPDYEILYREAQEMLAASRELVACLEIKAKTEIAQQKGFLETKTARMN